MSYSIKDKDKNSEAVVAIRNPKGGSFTKFKLIKATQEQLGRLFKIKHPFVIEDKKPAK